MDIKTITIQAIKEFEKEYKKAYKGILPDEVLEQGNEWFNDFLKTQITKAIEQSFDAVRVADIKIKKGKHSGKSWCPQCEDTGYNYATAQRITNEKEFLCSSHNQNQ